MADFQQDLRRSALEQLQAYGVRHRTSMELRELLIRLYTFWDRYIVPAQREVRLSKELRRQMPLLPEAVGEALEKMMEWMGQGVDINGFQSRGLYGGGSRDYQNMLYGVVHLHLTARRQDEAPVRKKDGFARPGTHLLYAYVRPDCMYLLGVGRHPGRGNDREWTRKALLEILVGNWPELMEDRRARGVRLCDGEGRPVVIDDEAIAQLTAAHINVPVPVGDSVYFPGGFTASGDSVRAVLQADRAIREAILAQRSYTVHQTAILEGMAGALRRAGRPVPERWAMHFGFHPLLNRFVVTEECSGAVWDYTRGKILLLSPPSP